MKQESVQRRTQADGAVAMVAATTATGAAEAVGLDEKTTGEGSNRRVACDAVRMKRRLCACGCIVGGCCCCVARSQSTAQGSRS